VHAIKRRLGVPVGERRGRTRGYVSADTNERFERQYRLQVLEIRLSKVEARLAEARVSVCRGGRGLARIRHHLEEAGLSPDEWKQR